MNSKNILKKQKKTLSKVDIKLQQAETLLSVSKKVSAMESVDEILESLVEIATFEMQAERGSLFINDPLTNELYSRVALGMQRREIRVMNDSGIIGNVYQSGKGVIIKNAYEDERFDKSIDESSGFHTKSILCTPLKNVKGEIIGCTQVLNKKKGYFTKADMLFLELITSQAAIALQSNLYVEKVQKAHEEEMEFTDIISDITGEIKIDTLLKKVMEEATRILKADRSTLFLNDEKTNELWSQVGQGLGTTEIRLPNHAGIAGTVFQTNKSINIPHAYADLRFNPSFDKKTGYFTRSILCVPLVNKTGKTIGVTQSLNKKDGPFNEGDEQRLKAFTAQIAIALENAKLFSDVQKMKNYNDAMLQSMSNGVITIDTDYKIVTCNSAGERIFQTKSKNIVGKSAKEFFGNKNKWVIERINRINETKLSESVMDQELKFAKDSISVNLTVLPLADEKDQSLGLMMMIDDISSEKRMKSTMSRYMDPSLADQLMGEGSELLGGQDIEATLLFSDVRSFTTITEQLGAQGTVKLLNDYFTIMVDCINKSGGMLDKFIGDAIMAGFGVPVAGNDDPDRAVSCGISMLNELKKWNAQRISKNLPPVEIGIGLNTGYVVSGNIGSLKRMDFTMIGDGVNLAARLESACKQYAAKLLISEFTYKKLKGIYRIRDVDLVVVKGKTEPVGVYEVLDFYNEEEFPNVMEVLGHFKTGIERFRKGSWKKAIDSFNKACQLHPKDKLSQIYIKRCEHLISDPPKNWQGVWVMTSK